MKLKELLIALILILGSICYAQVNGFREELSGNMIKLRCWGSHSERGYAQGYLLAEESVELFQDYVIDYMFSGNGNMYEFSRNLFMTNWEIDSEYLEEFAASLAGITAAGESIYYSDLGRELDEYDIAMVNSIVDILTFSRSRGIDLGLPDAFGCATLSSWGESTQADPLLSGDLLVTRHLDWNDAGILDNYPLMLVSIPSETDEQAFISFTYPLFVTGLSATNESGLTCFMNMGNNDTITSNGPYKPILLSMRTAIEKTDIDGNGVCDTGDMTAVLGQNNSVTDAIITCLKDSEGCPVIIEQNNTGTALRTQVDNSQPPFITGDNLVATNHFRVLYSPVYCSRYTALANQIEGNSNFDADRQWQVMSEAAGQGTWTRMTIQVCPEQGFCKWASTIGNTPAYETPGSMIDLDSEWQRWVNKPSYTARTAPVFLFLENGISEEEAGILSEFSGYKASMGINNLWDISFLADPEYAIEEYPQLLTELNISELPAVKINGSDASYCYFPNYLWHLCDGFLPSAAVKIEILELETETSMLQFSIEKLREVYGGEHNLYYAVWEENAAAGIDNLGLSWHKVEEELILPEVGETMLYEQVIELPSGDWLDKELGILVKNEVTHKIIQSASTSEENINPVQVSFDGHRDEELPIGETVCMLDTMTIFNTSEAECSIELDYYLLEECNPMQLGAEITRANGEEITCDLENSQEYTLQPGEYLYIRLIMEDLYDYMWQFCFSISSQETYSYDIPFVISRMTDTEEEEISAVEICSYNYPNPFNPSTSIVYDIALDRDYTLVIYNIRGEVIKEVRGLSGRGVYTWEADDLGSGIYLYQFEDLAGSHPQKMILLK